MNKFFSLGIIPGLLCALLLVNCKKNDEPTEDPVTTPAGVPSVVGTLTTNAFTSVTTTSATSGGTLISNGGASIKDRGLCYSLTPNPTTASQKVTAESVNGAGVFIASLSGLLPSTRYYVRAYVINNAGTGYGNEIELNTADIVSATFSFKPMFIIGSSLATTDVEVLSDGGSGITERGVCYGLTTNPTIVDHKVKHNSTGTGRFRSPLTELAERTTYHVRGYAINAKGVSYSSDVSFKTIGKGNITYTFNKAVTPTADELAAYERLQVALDSAVWYLNNYTSATKHVYLNYDVGVPTADANSEGWMRFGSSTGVQNIRTMLHEMNHTLGTGTTTWWTGKIIGGVYQGENASAMVKNTQNSTTAVLNGDTQHWWPGGLNQNSEVSSSWDYVYNCLIIEAMRKDGLPASGTYTP